MTKHIHTLPDYVVVLSINHMIIIRKRIVPNTLDEAWYPFLVLYGSDVFLALFLSVPIRFIMLNWPNRNIYDNVLFGESRIGIEKLAKNLRRMCSDFCMYVFMTFLKIRVKNIMQKRNVSVYDILRCVNLLHRFTERHSLNPIDYSYWFLVYQLELCFETMKLSREKSLLFNTFTLFIFLNR